MQMNLETRQTQERREKIIRIALSVQELSDLFRDLQLLIDNQGELIDDVQSNIIQAHEKVLKGEQDIKTAEAYHSGTRCCCSNCLGSCSMNRCICMLLFAIIVLIVIFVTKEAHT